MICDMGGFLSIYLERIQLLWRIIRIPIQWIWVRILLTPTLLVLLLTLYKSFSKLGPLFKSKKYYSNFELCISEMLIAKRLSVLRCGSRAIKISLKTLEEVLFAFESCIPVCTRAHERLKGSLRWKLSLEGNKICKKSSKRLFFPFRTFQFPPLVPNPFKMMPDVPFQVNLSKAGRVATNWSRVQHFLDIS